MCYKVSKGNISIIQTQETYRTTDEGLPIDLLRNETKVINVNKISCCNRLGRRTIETFGAGIGALIGSTIGWTLGTMAAMTGGQYCHLSGDKKAIAGVSLLLTITAIGAGTGSVLGKKTATAFANVILGKRTKEN